MKLSTEQKLDNFLDDPGNKLWMAIFSATFLAVAVLVYLIPVFFQAIPIKIPYHTICGHGHWTHHQFVQYCHIVFGSD